VGGKKIGHVEGQLTGHVPAAAGHIARVRLHARSRVNEGDFRRDSRFDFLVSGAVAQPIQSVATESDRIPISLPCVPVVY
jgi:hypothetical protein